MTPALVWSKITGGISGLLTWRGIHKESGAGARVGGDHGFVRTGKITKRAARAARGLGREEITDSCGRGNYKESGEGSERVRAGRNHGFVRTGKSQRERREQREGEDGKRSRIRADGEITKRAARAVRGSEWDEGTDSCGRGNYKESGESSERKRAGRDHGFMRTGKLQRERRGQREVEGG